MQLVSGSGPTDGDNPFEGLPFFGDLSKLLGGLGGSGGGIQWNTTRQVAMQIAAGGEAEPNIEPLVRIDLEELARIADLHVSSVTGLTTSVTGRGVTVVPVTRSQWTQRSFEAFQPLFESLAQALTNRDSEGDDPGESVNPFDPSDPLGGEGDPLSAMITQLMGAIAPMMLSVTAGGMLGHLAQRSFGQYDLPLPRKPSDELMLVLPNVDAFGTDWSIDSRDLRLWLCLHEIAHHAVLNVSHIREALETMIRTYASAFRPDASALTDRLESVDLSDSSALANMQEVLGDPGVMLGAIQTDEQRSMLPRLEALIAVIVGYVDHVMDTIGSGLIGSYSMITEAIHRRRVEADESDRFVARLFGLEISQSVCDAGTRFVDGVVERAGFDALDPLWKDAKFLPTPAEIQAPGLWLARIELPEAEENPPDSGNP